MIKSSTILGTVGLVYGFAFEVAAVRFRSISMAVIGLVAVGLGLGCFWLGRQVVIARAILDKPKSE